MPLKRVRCVCLFALVSNGILSLRVKARVFKHFLVPLPHKLEFPGSTMSHMMNMMLLKRSRGRPRKEGGGFWPTFGEDHRDQQHNPADLASASAYEMNWLASTGSAYGSTNNPHETTAATVTRGGGAGFPGRPGLFGRMKRGGGQYSTDDEEFEEVTMSDNEGVSVMLDQSNAPSSSSIMPPQEEGDSQQAAEAMVQLSGTTFFSAGTEESMEIDPNYDPSDFLGMSNRQLGSSEVETQQASIVTEQGEAVQFQYQQQPGQVSVFDNSFQQELQFGGEEQVVIGEQQQQLQLVQVEEPQPQSSSGLPPLQSLHKDLAISDSDEEQHNLQMDIFNNGNENDDNDDGGDLWF